MIVDIVKLEGNSQTIVRLKKRPALFLIGKEYINTYIEKGGAAIIEQPALINYRLMKALDWTRRIAWYRSGTAWIQFQEVHNSEPDRYTATHG